MFVPGNCRDNLESGAVLNGAVKPRRKRVVWSTLLNGILAEDESAGAALYRELGPIRTFFATQLSPVECEDRFHDVIVAVLRAIRIGGLRDPDSIPAYAWSTAQRIRRMRLSVIISQRESTTDVDSETLSDAAPDPESIAIRRQNKDVAVRVLAGLPERHREVLIRYYLNGQAPAVIQAEMGLTATQFRVTKSRAKAALSARLQRKLDTGAAAKISPLRKNSEENRIQNS
jgi:RNA polymerase sigma-70 factor, ECF subfamily